jgi:hypothetical protein
MLHWLQDHQGLLWLSGVASVIIFAASLIIIPALVVRIRPDYFAHQRRPPSRWDNQHQSVRIAMIIAKNVLGVVLMVAGIAMLVLPGQGMLTLLIGFMLMDFPGKYRFEKWLIGRRYVAGPINWLRRRRGRGPLQAASPESST